MSVGDQVTKSIIVKSDVETAYSIWSNFENFPMFMQYIEDVKHLGDGMTHWKMKGPLGKTLEWDAEITRMDENKRIAWSTKDFSDADVTTSGQVTFNELPQDETEVTVVLQYKPNAGIAGDIIDKLFANPEEKLDQDLRNFKDYVEGRLNRIGSRQER